MISILTPTYNRAYIIERTYRSIVTQSSKDIEWIIVDDGSTDNTRELIDSFLKENLITIKYIKQENQGKHIAINTGLKKVKGSYFFVLDSDDYLVPNMVDKIKLLINKIDKKNDIAGFTFIHFANDICVDYTEYGKKEWYDDKDYIWKNKGEMIFCYKIIVAKKYPYPNIKGEKFCPESLVHRRIMRSGFKILFTDNVLVRGEYMQDGLSSKFYQLLINSPRTSLIVYKEKILDSTSFEEKKELAKIYWSIASVSKISFYESAKGISFFLTMTFFLEKFLSKIKSLFKFYSNIFI